MLILLEWGKLYTFLSTIYDSVKKGPYVLFYYLFYFLNFYFVSIRDNGLQGDIPENEEEKREREKVQVYQKIIFGFTDLFPCQKKQWLIKIDNTNIFIMKG